MRAGGITICMGELVEAWQGKVEAPARPLWMDGMGVGVDGEWTRVVLVVVVAGG